MLTLPMKPTTSPTTQLTEENSKYQNFQKGYDLPLRGLVPGASGFAVQWLSTAPQPRLVRILLSFD